MVLQLLQPLRLVLQTQMVLQMLMVQQFVKQSVQVLHHHYRCLMTVTKR
jgi:hypothetical protein